MPSMSTKSREVIWGGRIMGAEIRAQAAREDAQRAVREADRRDSRGVVRPNGGLRRTRSAVSYDRAVPQRRVGLARGGVQSLQGESEPTA